MESPNLVQPMVAAALEKYSIAHRQIACDASFADTAAFCEEYDYALNQAANTILVAAKDDPANIVACVLLATTKLDVNKAVRKLMGAKRASFANAEQTVSLTGMLVGGVTVFGLADDMPVYVDSRVMEQTEVVMGGGNRDSKLVLNPDELTKLPCVQVVSDLALEKE